jgi:hypothetical protein
VHEDEEERPEWRMPEPEPAWRAPMSLPLPFIIAPFRASLSWLLLLFDCTFCVPYFRYFHCHVFVIFCHVLHSLHGSPMSAKTTTVYPD